MELFLHSPKSQAQLEKIYKSAFDEARELYIASAYLTSWNSSLKIGKNCEIIKIIIGKYFGITRKKACKDLINWMDKKWKYNVFVAEKISGFHPKVLFWKDINGEAFALVGSSNLTEAAFSKNFEANIKVEITDEIYESAVCWFQEIQNSSCNLDDGWIQQYVETKSNLNTKLISGTATNIIHRPTLKLPRPPKTSELLSDRRKIMKFSRENLQKLESLFKKCASKKISSEDFYEKLPEYWSSAVGNRMQGAGFERRGKSSNFQTLSESLIRILNARPSRRDDVVRREIDHLAIQKIEPRKAFLTEMLCHFYPTLYPVLNKPVQEYLSEKNFVSPRGSSEGAKYIYLANVLRNSLRASTGYPAKNLAELDTLIWAATNH
jgi:hypothetical protein